MTLRTLKRQAMTLPKKQRIKLVQDLWDSIELEQADVPISDSERRLLAQRLKKVKQSPSSGAPWAVVRRRVLKQIQGVE